MLVLSRKVDERFHIGSDIVITVVEIQRGKVRIGIQAPKHVPVLRQELIDAAATKQADERKT